MKKIIISALLILSSLFNLFSGSFSDAVKSAENDKEPPKQNYSKSSSSSDDDDDSLFLFFLKLFGWVWISTNIGMTYYDYPYQELSLFGYVVNTKFLDTAGISNDYVPKKSFRFSTDASIFKMKTLGFGNEMKFEGQFWFIGPYFSNTIYSDDLNDFSNNIQGNLKLGGQLFLLQTNPLMISFIFQGAKWYGNEIPKSLNSGTTIGFDFHSYPIKPLAIQWLGTWSYFDNNVGIYESNLNLGVFINRFEIYAAWRYMEVYNSETDNKSDHWHGFGLGTKIYF